MSFKHILLIDDDEDDTEIFLAALEIIDSGINCSAFSNAKNTLEQLVAGTVHTDLVVLDLNMPVMNGQQFLTEIKKADRVKHIPVVILSTSSHKPTIELTKELGAVDFITKPEKFEDLIARLRILLGE